MNNIKIISKESFCKSEPDYKIQELNLELNCSAGEDNHTDYFLVRDVCNRFKKKINCLDLGCAGGALVLDFNDQPETKICIGLDGSNGVYRHKSWNNQKNKNVLQHCNLVEKFFIKDSDGIVIFDAISCFEVIEHFEIGQLDVFFKNVLNHLSDDGFFYGSIALFPDTRDSKGYHQDHPRYDKNLPQFKLHKTVLNNKEEWDNILEKYFKIVDYDFCVKMRNHSNSYYFKCLKKN